MSFSTQYEGITGYIKGKGIATTLAKLYGSTLSTDLVGKVYFNAASGVIKTVKVNSNQPIYVDNQDIIAYTEGLKCSIERAGGSFKSLFLSGEGLVCKFEGDGTVYIGTGAAKNQANALHSTISESHVELIKFGVIAGAICIAAIAALIAEGPEATWDLFKALVSNKH